MKATDFTQTSDILDPDYVLIFKNNKPCIATVGSLNTTLVGDFLPITGGIMSGRISGAPSVIVNQATTVDLSLSNTNYIGLRTDGSADPIESFGTLPEGTRVCIRLATAGGGWNGFGYITASANIITPNGLDINTNPLDYFEMLSYGGGIWRITLYVKNNQGFIYNGYNDNVSESFALINPLGQNFTMNGSASDEILLETAGSMTLYMDGVNLTANLGAANNYININAITDTAKISTDQNGTFELLDASSSWTNFNGDYISMDTVSMNFFHGVLIDTGLTPLFQHLGGLLLGKEINTTAGDSATIDQISGRFRKDTSGATFTLTNSYITANSIILLTPANAAIDATAINWTVSAGTGSATITFVAAPTANFDMNFFVIN